MVGLKEIIWKFLFALLLISLDNFSSFCSNKYSQTLPTEKGTLDVKLSYDEIVLGELTTLRTDFINPQTQKYTRTYWLEIFSFKRWWNCLGANTTNSYVWRFIKKFKVWISRRWYVYNLEFEIEGILFQPIPLEKVSFVIRSGRR